MREYDRVDRVMPTLDSEGDAVIKLGDPASTHKVSALYQVANNDFFDVKLDSNDSIVDTVSLQLDGVEVR